jgi:hypothetical protein
VSSGPGEDDLVRRLDFVLEAIERAADSVESHGLPEATVQRLLTTAVKAYCQAIEVHDRPIAPFTPAPGGVSVTTTEALATATEMLRAVDIEPFELGMWWSRGSLYTPEQETRGAAR